MMRWSFALGMAALAGLALPAVAQEAAFEAPLGLSEVRIGGHFHDVYPGFIPFQVDLYEFDQLEDLTFEALFQSPDLDVFRWMGSPRPNVGATINLDNQDSHVHLGLTWQAQLFDTPIYVEGTFGIAAHNGYLNEAPPGRINFGCRVNFYEQFGIGTHITENFTATLTYEHTSNADLCEVNAGMSTLGVRLGYKF